MRKTTTQRHWRRKAAYKSFDELAIDLQGRSERRFYLGERGPVPAETLRYMSLESVLRLFWAGKIFGAERLVDKRKGQ